MIGEKFRVSCEDFLEQASDLDVRGLTIKSLVRDDLTTSPVTGDSFPPLPVPRYQQARMKVNQSNDS